MREKDSNDPIPTRPSQVASTQDRGEPRRSGRVVTQPDRFIGLGEIPVGIETDPGNYNEAEIGRASCRERVCLYV